MKELILSAVIATTLLSGCTSIEVVDVRQLDRSIYNPKKVTINSNDKVFRNEFVLYSMSRWANENDVKFEIDNKGESISEGQYVMDYIVGWHWDGTNYINDAKFTLLKEKQIIGYADFDGHGLLNFNKFKDDGNKIKLILDVVFNTKTVEEVNSELD